MSEEFQPEVWLRGPIPEIPALLQPSAHALLQTAEELYLILKDFPEELLTTEIAGRATASFHLKHMIGVLDRMLTYSRGQALSEEQFEYLRAEKASELLPPKSELIAMFETKVLEALAYYKTLEDADLTSYRAVGRKQLPSTIMGLLFHAAEHAQRHLGALLVTVSVVKELKS